MNANPKSHQASLSNHPQGRRYCLYDNNAISNESAIEALEVRATCVRASICNKLLLARTPYVDNRAYILCLVVSKFCCCCFFYLQPLFRMILTGYSVSD